MWIYSSQDNDTNITKQDKEIDEEEEDKKHWLQCGVIGKSQKNKFPDFSVIHLVHCIPLNVVIEETWKITRKKKSA